MRDVKEGDVCMLDESVEYSINPKEPFYVIVLWNGMNGQPLVTKCDKYNPFWSTYSQLTKKVSHIDMDSVLPFI